jgi:glycosyltransferase involved in cell wall biosynthesis
MTVVVEGYIAGGADRVLAQLLPYFQSLRIELLVNANLDTGILLNQPLPANVSLRKYSWTTPASLGNWAVSTDSAAMILPRRVLSVLLRYPVMVLLFLRFFRYFRKNRPELLFINNGGYPGGEACRMAAAAAVAHGGIRIVHLIHSMAIPALKLFQPMEWLIDRIIERQGSLIAVSDAVARSISHDRKLKAKVITIYNGLPTAPLPLPPPCVKPLEFLQVGYMCQEKNQKFSILALSILARQGFKDIRITFAGEEVEKGYLHTLTELAKQLGVSDQVRFAGFVRDIEGMYPHCDAVLLTSTVEGMPMCILEAMRAGRAVIATAVGGVPEVIEHSRTGYLLKGADPAELSKILKQLLDEPETLEQMGDNAYRLFLEKFTLDAQVGKYLELINLPPLKK